MNRARELIEIKADILCSGLRSNKITDKIYSLQHPTIHKRTGNAGIQVILEKKLVLNAIYGEKFCINSPYSIEEKNSNFFICKKGKILCDCFAIKSPGWYKRHTSDGVIMADVILQEGANTLISGIWNNCCYFSDGTQCKFCIFGFEKGLEWKNVDRLAETVEMAIKENPNYILHLTGGNTFSPDRGIAYYEKYIRAIRKKTDMPISIEVSPPEDLKYIDNIVNAGVGGFSINIEVWDEQKRKEICPGKSKIKKEEYFKAWEKAVGLVGKFKVSSVIIIGLDAPENIAEGIKEMVKMGVKPALIPFRPFAGSALAHLPIASSRELLELSALAGKELVDAGAHPDEFFGCEYCGACTTEKDFMYI